MTRLITMLESDEPCMCGRPVASLLVFGLILFTLVCGTVYSIRLGNTLTFADEALYVMLADHLVSQKSYTANGGEPFVHRPPGYSFFIYPIFLIGGQVVHVRIAQFVLLALSICLLYKILQLWSHHLASVIAGMLVVCYPVLFFTAGTLFPQTVTSVLFLAVCYFMVRPEVDVSSSVFGGIAFGMLVLTTTMFLVMMPLLLLFHWVLKSRNAFLTTILFLLTATAMVTPWMIRNYVTFDRLVPIASNSGEMLLRGNSDYYVANPGTIGNVDKYKRIAEIRGISGLEKDSYYRAEAAKWIFNNKAKAAQLYVHKLLAHFHFRNEMATGSENRLWRDVVMFVSYYALLIMACLRVFMGGSLKSRPFEVFAVLSYVMLGAVYAIFFTRIRYRLPVDWMLIGVAAIYAASLLEGIKGRAVGSSPVR